MFNMDIQPISCSGGEIDVNNWNVKLTYRGKNRMKITFKLSQDEAAAYTSFQQVTCPEHLSEEQFVKSIFFLGLTTLEQNVTEHMADAIKIEDGEVPLKEVEEDISESEDNII